MFSALPGDFATLQNSFTKLNCQISPSGTRTSTQPMGRTAAGGSLMIGCFDEFQMSFASNEVSGFAEATSPASSRRLTRCRARR